MVKAIVTDKGAVTIPEVIREKFGLEAGTTLLFDENASSFVVTTEVDLHRMSLALGCATEGLPGYTSQSWLDETRGRVED